MNLFDRRLAERDLFDPDALRYFNLENVYYRSAFHRNIRWPSRILWYVSKGSEKTQIEVGAVKACSILKSIDVGLPKETFTKYRRLGIYSWREVLGTTGGDLWKNVMAILFSHTEYFDAAVPLNFINEIGIRGTVRSPREITDEQFEKIYRKGVEWAA